MLTWADGIDDDKFVDDMDDDDDDADGDVDDDAAAVVLEVELVIGNTVLCITIIFHVQLYIV